MSEKLDILDAVWKAYNSKFGVVIRADPQRVRSAFYSARATDPCLMSLGLYNNPLAVDEFFILKREIYDAARKAAREEDIAVSGGGLGVPDEHLPAPGTDDFTIDP